jgi:hypothetical protein
LREKFPRAAVFGEARVGVAHAAVDVALAHRLMSAFSDVAFRAVREV